jgi:hypothetical protein
MDLWLVIGLIGAAGALGGVANAISTDNSFALPRPVKDGKVTVAWQAGVVGNMFTAVIAALVSWGLYGPSSTFLVVGKPPTGTTEAAVTLTVTTLATAILIGYGGARWLTNEFDKKILKATASAAAAGAADEEKATKIANSSPAEGFRIATGRSV